MSVISEAIAAPPPLLLNGDHLTRHEFERRYIAMPNVKKAELIEGVVYMPSPVGNEHHGSPHFDLITWLGLYRSLTPGVKGADNTTLRLDIDNEFQPDALLRIETNFGGQSQISEDDYLVGAPELVAEISASSVSYDLHEKFNVYRRCGVREYMVWRVMEDEIDWFILREGKFVRLEQDSSGLNKSEVFPGLWLDSSALIRRDLAKVIQRLQDGLTSQEHTAFVAQLQKPGKV